MPRAPLKPLKQPVQQRSRHTVDAILEAAVQVFESHGYAAGTTARIAARAGVSVGTLYQYFPNKDAILAALAERHLDEIAAFSDAALSRLAAGGALPALPALVDGLVDGFVAMHAANPALHRLLSGGEFLLDDTRRRLRRMATDGAARLAAGLAAHPQVREGDPQVLAWFVVHSLEHFTHTLVLDPPPRAVRGQVAAELKRMLVGYLRRPGTARRARAAV